MIHMCHVFTGSWGQTRSLFLVCILGPVFKKVKFDVRRSWKPFKGKDGRFDPSATAPTKRSQTHFNSTRVLCILSASV